MNQYIIQQKIKTVSELSLFDGGMPIPMVVKNVKFMQWSSSFANGPKGGAWVAEGEENAENYHDAVIKFRKKLNKIVPKIAFVSQCYMDYSQAPFLVLKKNNNNNKIGFIYYTTNKNSPGLMFMEEEKNDFESISINNNEFFLYMNDCYNTTGYTAKLLLMFAALESLVGKEIKIDNGGNEYATYDKEKMKAILGEKLFNELYGYGGMRHKLSHGEYIDKAFSGKNYVEILHNSILRYFNNLFSLSLNTGIVHPQRHPFGMAYLIKSFIKLKEDSEMEITLKNILRELDAGDLINSYDFDNFELIPGSNLGNTY